MKTMFFKFLVGLLAGLIAIGTMNPPKPAPAPVIQRGEVAITLDEHGVALEQFAFPAEFRDAPVVVVTPRGEGGFVVESFFSDAFDGEYFVVGVQGQPGLTVKFYWVAVSR